jgi:hypothetical protein
VLGTRIGCSLRTQHRGGRGLEGLVRGIYHHNTQGLLEHPRRLVDRNSSGSDSEI